MKRNNHNTKTLIMALKRKCPYINTLKYKALIYRLKFFAKQWQNTFYSLPLRILGMIGFVAFICGGCQKDKYQNMSLSESDKKAKWNNLVVVDRSISKAKKHSFKPFVVTGAVNKNWCDPDGINATKKMEVPIIADRLKLLYSRNIGNTSIFSNNENLAKIVICHNRVFALGNDFKIRMFDEKSGKKIWTKAILSSKDTKKFKKLIGAISISDDLLVVSLITGEVVCFKLNLKTIDKGMDELWRFNSNYAFKSQALFNKNRIVLTSVNGHTTCLDKNNGSVLWSHRCLTKGVVIAGGSVALIDNDVVYIAYFSNEIYAISLYNGNVLWESYMPQHESEITKSDISHIRAMPVKIRDLLLVYGFDKLAFYDIKAGIALDQNRTTPNPWSNAAKFSLPIGGTENMTHYGKRLFLLAKDGNLFCLHSPTRELIWQKRLPYEDENTMEITKWYGPTLVQEENSNKTYLILSSNTGILKFVNVNDTNDTKIIKSGTEFIGKPIVVNKKIIVISNDGYMFVYGNPKQK